MLLESALCGARIGDVAQPDFEQLLLMVEPPGGAGGRRARVLRVSHQPHRCVIHLSDMDMPKVARPLPRFMQLARARLRGGVIRGCFQYNDQRIVRMAIECDGRRLALWTRLWSAAANTFLTDGNDVIIDCYYRRPRAGEISGANLRSLLADKLGDGGNGGGDGGNGKWRRREIAAMAMEMAAAAVRCPRCLLPYDCALRDHEYDSYNRMIDQRYRIEHDNSTRKALADRVTGGRRSTLYAPPATAAVAARNPRPVAERKP